MLQANLEGKNTPLRYIQPVIWARPDQPCALPLLLYVCALQDVRCGSHQVETTSTSVLECELFVFVVVLAYGNYT
jgi:hypothetical protein